MHKDVFRYLKMGQHEYYSASACITYSFDIVFWPTLFSCLYDKWVHADDNLFVCWTVVIDTVLTFCCRLKWFLKFFSIDLATSMAVFYRFILFLPVCAACLQVLCLKWNLWMNEYTKRYIWHNIDSVSLSLATISPMTSFPCTRSVGTNFVMQQLLWQRSNFEVVRKSQMQFSMHMPSSGSLTNEVHERPT